MKINVGYKKNEWLAVYVTADGEREFAICNTYEEAEKEINRLRNCGICIIGTMTTRFYNHYVEEIIDK